MKLKVTRIFIGDTYTIGHLDIEGEYFCDTLEDIPRSVKVPGKTCIPAGIYKVIINYSNRFKKSMPLLLNVPGFDGVRIHPGNNSDDTSGCILVGENKVKGGLINSRVTYNSLYERLLNATRPITIEIV